MSALYELHDRPELDRPVLLVAVEGWIDAGFAAAQAAEVIVGQSDTTLVASFDTDTLLDYRARRPTLHLVDGVHTGLTWSTIELHALRAPNGTSVLLLSGVEPDHAWHRFTTELSDLAVDLGVVAQYGFGAYPAGVPHSRPVALSATASSDELAHSVGFIRGTIDVPAGIEAVIEQSFADAGLPALGIWAQVPHYVSSMRYPAASARLIEGLNQAAGTDFSIAPLADEIAETRANIDSLLEKNPEHVAMLRQLEAQADAVTEDQIADLPSGDQLAEELQQFLREQGPEP